MRGRRPHARRARYRRCRPSPGRRAEPPGPPGRASRPESAGPASRPGRVRSREPGRLPVPGGRRTLRDLERLGFGSRLRDLSLRLGSGRESRGLGGLGRLGDRRGLGRREGLERRSRLRHDRFCNPRVGRHGRYAPRDRALRRNLTELRHIEVLGPDRRRTRVPYGSYGGGDHGIGHGRRGDGSGAHRGTRRAAVGQRAHRARGAVRCRRAEVQRAARRRRLRGGRQVRRADGAEVDRATVAPGHLVRARLVEEGHRGRRRHLVAPRALGARGARHQKQVVVLDGVLGGVEEGVRARRGDARLLHHACVLRQSLARDLAGVGHAYPSPIG